MRIRDPGWRQFGSGIRYGKKSNPGCGINIPDPQHWFPSGFENIYKTVFRAKALLLRVNFSFIR
jgi:hypothetical protein